MTVGSQVGSDQLRSAASMAAPALIEQLAVTIKVWQLGDAAVNGTRPHPKNKMYTGHYINPQSPLRSHVRHHQDRYHM